MRAFRYTIIPGFLMRLLGMALACESNNVRKDAGPDADLDADLDAGPDANDDAGISPLTDNTLLLSTGIFNNDGVTNIMMLNAVAAPGERCRLEWLDRCLLVDCSPETTDAPLPLAVNLGTVELMRGGETLLSAEPNADGIYPVTYVTRALWGTGDELSFVGHGGDVIDFTIPFVGPSMVTLTYPTNNLTVSILEPLPVEWEPVDSGVTITMSQTPAGATNTLTSRRFICEVDGSVGTFEIPPTVLAVLSPGSAFINVGGNTTQNLDVQGYSVHFHATHATTLTMNIE